MSDEAARSSRGRGGGGSGSGGGGTSSRRGSGRGASRGRSPSPGGSPRRGRSTSPGGGGGENRGRRGRSGSPGRRHGGGRSPHRGHRRSRSRHENWGYNGFTYGGLLGNGYGPNYIYPYQGLYASSAEMGGSCAYGNSVDVDGRTCGVATGPLQACQNYLHCGHRILAL
jgi:hypothetical protein